MKYALSLWIVLLLLLQGSAQRPELKRITGKVVSATTGRGLPDITLILKRSGKQATTNMQGIFSVALSVPDTLVIRHISYKEQRLFVSSENNSPLFILLEENTHQLDEVIVNTGYQSVPKERATGSFTQIDSKLYNEQVGTNALNRLEYITNGLSVNRRINSNGQISIRGLSTIQGPQDPLIVVDNFPYNGDINNINANDIETVTILKDAAASSIWGAKAGNGVIVITTKKGSFNQRSKIDLNTNITIVNKPDLFYLPNISSGDFIDVEKYLFDQGYRFDDTLDTYHKPFSPVYEILFKERNGEISAADASSQINAYRNHDVRNDFNKYFYQKAVNQQYALNVQGGSNTVAYILSAAYDHNSDNLAAGYNRVSIKSANTFKITPSLQIDAGVIYTYSKTTNGKPAYDGSSIRTINGAIPPYTMLADAAGNALPLYKDYRQTYTDTAGGGKLLNWNYYPLTDYMFTHTSSVISDVVGNLGFRYKLNKDLSIEGKYQYERQTVTGRTLYDQQSYYTRNLINTYSQPDYTTGQVTYIVPLGAILDLSSGLLESHQARGQLNYNKSWGNNSITAIAGGEIRQAHTTSDGYRTYGYDDNILTSVNVDAANTYPNFVTGNYDYIPTNASFSDNLNRFVSVYANAAYTWLNRYTLSASARRDASNIFGVNTNNKWSPLWSLGSSWEISREKFYASALLPYLKARLTYGFSGNVDPNLSAVTTISYLSTSPYTQTPFAQVANFYNPDLRWEKTGMINMGFDFAARNNVISGSIDYYHKRGRNLYGPSLVDVTVGLATTTITKNVASMASNGVDIALNIVNINGVVKWITNFNFNYNKDHITDYYLADLQGSDFINGGQGIAGIQGKPIYSVFSYKWAGLDPATGDPQGYLNGQVSKDYASITSTGTSITGLKYNGPALPVIYGSMGNTVSWNGISITARVTYKLGYYFQRQSINYTSLFASSQGHSDYARRWQKPGDEKTTNVPSMIYPATEARDAFYSGSEVLVDKGDNIRLQYINISYELNHKTIRHLPFEKIQFYLIANDLGILWVSAQKVGVKRFWMQEAREGILYRPVIRSLIY